MKKSLKSLVAIATFSALALAALFQDRTDWHGRVPRAVAAAIINEGEAAA